MADQIDVAHWTERLLALDTGLISDVLDEAGLSGRALSPVIAPVGQAQKTAGPVVCARGGRVTGGAHAPPAMPAANLERSMSHGAVLVLASGGMTEAAPIGGIVTRSLVAHGCKGVVTDAAVRDREELMDIGLPVYAGGASPANAARIWQFLAVGEPVTMPAANGGPLTVAPGDFIIADADGTVVIPRHSVTQIVEDAEELKQIEQRIISSMETGLSRTEAFAMHPRFAHVRPAFGTFNHQPSDKQC